MVYSVTMNIINMAMKITVKTMSNVEYECSFAYRICCLFAETSESCAINIQACNWYLLWFQRERADTHDSWWCCVVAPNTFSRSQTTIYNTPLLANSVLNHSLYRFNIISFSRTKFGTSTCSLSLQTHNRIEIFSTPLHDGETLQL
jgi:hypothetical protein